MCFSDQSILITGAAGLIGSVVSKKAFDTGATVMMVDISTERLQKVSKSFFAEDPDRIFLINGDTATSNGIDLAISKCQDLPAPPIRGAVHCAYPRSPGWGAKFEHLNGENLNYDLNMQLGGAIMFSQKILSIFQAQGGGSLVHVSSIQGIRAPKFEHYTGTEMNSPIEYSAIKAGVISITSWLAKYYSNQNIRVNCVSPGGILDGQPQSFLEKYRNSCSNIGMLSPEDIASTIVFLLSPDSAAINGHNMIVDDGWSL